ncbi:hybrid sensor histidine kinase/response regulator [Desulfoplanes formicivorans]|uniref:histidine kinase n=1 Tax=Desulfoplanes formicivorans TaxID=1592317 RepID=A0A194AFB1_9BACT|nr:PAS domain S-box protein [Desulfoplanes formicivorans]GAU08757.1 histidine kinase [Desulfoplanes formicivorans]
MEQKHILIVDDEAAIRDMIVAMLGKYSAHVCAEAESADQARNLLAARPFDLMIVDIRLPEESGLDLARDCHTLHPHTAIITMTGFGNRTVAKEALEIGVYGHLNKPFGSDQLLIAVDNALKRMDLEKQRQMYLNELEQLVERRTAQLSKTLHRMEMMQKGLRESEWKYRSILENIQEAYFRVDMDGRILMTNPSGMALLGFSGIGELCGLDVEDMCGMDAKNFVIEPEQMRTLRAVLREQGKISNFELSLCRRDKSRFTGLANMQVVTDANGEQVAVEGTVIDITRRKEMESRVRASERNYRIIFERSPLGMLRLNSDGVIADCNETFVELMGASKEQLVGFNPAKNTSSKMRKIIARALGGEVSVYEDEYTSVTGGKTIELRAIMNPVTPGKTPTEVIAILEDIGVAKKAQQELVRSLEANKQLVDKIPSLLIQVAEGGTVLQWNPVAESVLGIPAEEVIGKPLQDIDLDWDREVLVRTMNQCLEQEEHIRLKSMTFHRADGYEGVLGLTVTPLSSGPVAQRSLLLMGADITERLNLETQLSHARKLESVGQLAAGIAHEINTPTQYISDNTHFFKDSFEDIREVVGAYRQLFDACAERDVEPALREHIEEALEEADWEFLEEEIPQAIDQSLEGLERVADIVRSMKDFSHPGTKEKTVTDINRALASTITVSRNVWKYVADLEENFDEALPPITCLPGEINQVFLNLITNAAHAIGDKVGDGSQGKGRITVTTRHDDAWVDVLIADTGAGIPEHIAHRVFDPFFTTKEVGRGTGQGLNICRMIVVEKHGGEIDFTTRPGEGTTFVVRLPRR